MTKRKQKGGIHFLDTLYQNIGETDSGWASDFTGSGMKQVDLSQVSKHRQSSLAADKAGSGMIGGKVNHSRGKVNHRKKKVKRGGAETTFCMCAESSTACYGSMECDCSNPKAARCVKTGISTKDEVKNKSKVLQDIKDILAAHKNKVRNNTKVKNNTKVRNNTKVKNNNRMKVLPLKDRYVEEIKQGMKTVDIKPVNRTTENIKVGDVVVFKGETKQVKARVVNMICHKYLHSAFKASTLKRVLPRSSKTYKQGVVELKRYFGAYNNKHNNKKYISMNLVVMN